MRRVFFLLALLAIIGVAAAASSAGWLRRSEEPRWVDLNEGLPSYAITTALAFDAGDDNLVYAAVYFRHGVYRSEDGGLTWRQADQGLDGAAVYALAASPIHPQVVYAGATDGLYLSTDAAHSWRRLSLPEKPVFSLLISRSAPGCIYAGSYAQLSVSRDGGETWTSLTRGLTGVTLISLAANEEAPETLYAGTSGGGILQTNDGGATWGQAFATREVVSAVAVRSQDGMVLARGADRLLRGINGGHEWEDVGTLPDGRRPLSLLALPGDGADLLAGSDGGGVFITADGGTTWQALGEGLGRARVTAMAASQRDPRRLLAGTPHGVFVSSDGGSHWEAGKGIGRPIVRGIIAGQAEGQLLAGTTDGLYELSMAGWRLLWKTQEETSVLSSAIVPGRPERLYAGTWGASIQRSSDGGQTWQLSARSQYSQTIIPALLVDPYDTNRLYARVEYDRLIASDDGGDNWRPIDVGLDNVTVFAVAASPARAGLLYAGTDKGVYRSSDGGARWSSTGRALWSGSTFAVAVDSRDGDRLQVGTTSGVFLSKDGSRSWTAADGLQDVTVSSLVFSTDKPSRGFAGTRFHGVYGSEDVGATWRPLGKGLADATVNALALDEKAKRLAAATEEGVFTLALPDG